MKFQVVLVAVVLVAVVAGKKDCKYTKGSWGECDTTTNMRSRSMTLRRGDPECAQTSTQTISCEKYDQIYKMKDEKKKARELMKAEKKVVKDMQKKLKGSYIQKIR
ncbi:Hypothetical predicted protein [Mytilus galloprovincialis]|uniref:Pleiotrophin/Midkine C-terminal domain-containing protein n=2 Tax=Mytilus galloprovincialis TaxID=29158 RepID=A0A8B6EAN2_MYTGA|nr:Hypothetical predicted protein [Mytilus galloprovincialis]